MAKDKQIKIKVIDTNGKTIGKKQVTITEYDSVIHDMARYGLTEFFFTGKTGTNIKTNKQVKEYASEQDARIWLAVDLSFSNED